MTGSEPAADATRAPSGLIVLHAISEACRPAIGARSGGGTVAFGVHLV
jgi:hypothetical protein